MITRKEMFRRIVNLEILCAELEDRVDLLEVKKVKAKKTVKKTK